MARTAKPKPLTDTELVILNAAAGRPDRCVLPWPKSLKAASDQRDATVRALLKRGLLMAGPTARKSALWRTGATGEPLTLTVTDVGVAALEPAASKPTPIAVSKNAGTKGETILALLHTKGGTTIAALMSATGWQAHSIRGYLSGTVAKRLGHTVRSVKADGQERRYHVEA